VTDGGNTNRQEVDSEVPQSANHESPVNKSRIGSFFYFFFSDNQIGIGDTSTEFVSDSMYISWVD
jgi:hypothetical protein